METCSVKPLTGLGRRRFVFVFLLLVIFATSVLGQGWPTLTDSTTFADIRQHFEQYWADKTPEKGSGWKVYKRWEWYWESRLMPDGRLPPAGYNDQEFRAYLNKHPEVNAESSAANWTSEGPTNSNSGYFGLGRVNCMAFDPNSSNTMWAGTPAGGLWKTTNGGTTWIPLTDNNIAVLGITAIAVHPTDPNTIYIATGDGFGSATYSTGVLKTTNGGTSTILLAATSVGLYRTTNSG
ncbi:MAG: hypothetical protein IPM98_06225 [Lewinellaceae bacterium]|nr:hypothetical protein [Lewinellaceae bacterium]